ncbi:hypothetical protein [uncultured Helicobacter sp.]|uniref:hypothetical protein n=1 Tax=uncultured Helicobacter sp. TaxID=175537 RepID=UPI002605D6B1|nr:hypothetical protein [uncultured Helicobacter sp.]
MTKILITLKDITVTGGAERVCVNLANALSNRGYEVIIASFYQVHAAPPPTSFALGSSFAHFHT